MNYLSDNTWKSVKMQLLDEEILVYLACTYDMTIEEVKELTSQEISDLIETWDFWFSRHIDRKIEMDIENYNIKEFLSIFDNFQVITYEDFWNEQEDINKNLNKYKEIFLYDVRVDIFNVNENIKSKLPNYLKRFVFDRESYTWVRFYYFKEIKKIAVWFFWWSAWRGNDIYFKQYFKNEWVVKNIKLSSLINIIS